MLSERILLYDISLSLELSLKADTLLIRDLFKDYFQHLTQACLINISNWGSLLSDININTYQLLCAYTVLQNIKGIF